MAKAAGQPVVRLAHQTCPTHGHPLTRQNTTVAVLCVTIRDNN